MEEKNIYKKSRIILAILIFVIFSLMFIYEDSSWMILTIFFSIFGYFVSIPCTIITKKIISIGNKIKSKVFRFLYYAVVLPTIIIGLFLIIYNYIMNVYDNSTKPIPVEIDDALREALYPLFLITISTICIIIPYVQSLIVLILKKINK